MAIGLAMSVALSGGVANPPIPAMSVEALDARVILPAAARPKESYVRFYLPMDVADIEDLPFTTMVDVQLKSRKVVVGLFVVPGEWEVVGPPGVRGVSDRSGFPFAVHGGCLAVNVLLNPDTGETLGSWCNVDGGDMPGRQPLPVYLPPPAR